MYPKTLKAYFNWSSGKDSALALYYLLQDNNYSVPIAHLKNEISGLWNE